MKIFKYISLIASKTSGTFPVPLILFSTEKRDNSLDLFSQIKKIVFRIKCYKLPIVKVVLF
jgi:hypothetical protein